MSKRKHPESYTPHIFEHPDGPRISQQDLILLTGCSRGAIQGWNSGGYLLGGDRLVSIPLDNPKGCQRVLTYSKTQADRILAALHAREESANGDRIYHDGRWWITSQRAARELGYERRSLQRWESYCPYLNRPLRPYKSPCVSAHGELASTSQTWYAEDDILTIKAKLDTDFYGEASDPYITAGRARTDPTLRLQSAFIKAKVEEGVLEEKSFPRKNDPGRCVMTYRKSALLKLKQDRDCLMKRSKGRVVIRYFGGEYPDGRLSIRRAAQRSGVKPGTISCWIKRGLLETKRQKPPIGRGRAERTVFLAEVQQILQRIRDEKKQLPPAAPYLPFKRLKERIAPGKKGQQFALGQLIRYWRVNGKLHHPKATMDLGGLRRKPVYYYRPNDVLALLGGLTPSQARQRIKSECANRETRSAGAATADEAEVQTSTPHSEPDAESAKGRQGGRPRGETAKWKAKKEKLIDLWKNRKPGDSKASLAKIAGLNRPDASKIINAYEKSQGERA